MKRLLLSFMPITIITLVISGWAYLNVESVQPWVPSVPDLPAYPGAQSEARTFDQWSPSPHHALSFTTTDSPGVVREKYKSILLESGWRFYADCPPEYQIKYLKDGAMSMAKILTTVQEDGSTKVEVQAVPGFVGCDVVRGD
jgi:hypothetical protein